MNFIKELFKLIKIINFIIVSIYRAFFSKDRLSKNFLTDLYLKAAYDKSFLELSSIQLENDDQLIISGGQLSSGHLSSDERLTLQSREELIALLSLLITKKPLRIFEFGLMRGGSLLHFYLNTSEKVKIDSLDCNLKNLTPYVQSIISLNNRITIHEQNSLDFDETPFKSLIDFIFIDGGHEYNIVKNDTEKAFFMLSSSGTIVWDDYSPHFPGVYNFINELSIEHKGLKQIKGTSLVYIEKIKQ